LIDFLPGVDIKKLLGGGTKQITSVFGLPRMVSKAFLIFVDLEDKIIEKLANEGMERLYRLKNYEFAPAGNFGMSKAEITKGGVDTADIELSNMRSRLQKGLYFIGEALNVNGELGGYNFH
jgi:hypothetical protein